MSISVLLMFQPLCSKVIINQIRPNRDMCFIVSSSLRASTTEKGCLS